MCNRNDPAQAVFQICFIQSVWASLDASLICFNAGITCSPNSLECWMNGEMISSRMPLSNAALIPCTMALVSTCEPRFFNINSMLATVSSHLACVILQSSSVLAA